eukprot:6193052-Pleurochrysis_carterae.AAC.4
MASRATAAGASETISTRCSLSDAIPPCQAARAAHSVLTHTSNCAQKSTHACPRRLRRYSPQTRRAQQSCDPWLGRALAAAKRLRKANNQNSKMWMLADEAIRGQA